MIRPKKANALAQNISIYAAGCLHGAEALTVTGNGYSGDAIVGSAFLGHPDLPGFGEKMGNAATRQHGGVLMIGELVQPCGAYFNQSSRL